MGKSENVFVFEDTEKTCKDMPYLSLAIKQSRKMQDIFWGETPDPAYKSLRWYSSADHCESETHVGGG